ncbi:MAG: hypothetical protein CMG94_01745 [Marinoscillum sp.]|nr:hypothetical protein [Marinoscillum sp.]OUX27041.1 MAG: hypothetical protein CBE22_00620 [Flammeovirgaceae bacterium TMED262]|tara:strand:- start:20729 stop:22255 length:1527 start_codon:yes stop_codon:yes gene_type:complete
MDKNKFLLIVILTATSLISILLVQFSWISQIDELNDERFDKDINDVLFIINQKLEEREIINLTRDNLQATFKISRSNETGGVELIESIFNKTTLDQGGIESTQNSLQFDLESGSAEGTDSEDNINASILVEDFNEITIDTAIQKQINKVLDRSEMIQIILNKLLTGDRNIKTELNKTSINKLILAALKQKNIEIEYDYLLLDKEKNSIVVSNTDDNKILKSKFSISLFQNDMIDSGLVLYLDFPSRESYLRDNNIYGLTFSFLFIILIALSFYYVIIKAFKLKKLSDIKNDFIDNMTHELKTPISTISLACEAMIDSKDKKVDYVNIIDEENKRLGSQVERVLNIARTEKETYKLDRYPVNIHDIIHESVNIFKFKVEKKDGKIIKKLNANSPIIKGNKDHLINVFNNLIENAYKYSDEKPIIIIESSNNSSSLEISIKDNGIGIKKSNIDKIFDKFYREPQGNIHNVKGFGLGLSYVKNIVNKLGASILVKSKYGSGSTFTLRFNYE